MEPIRILWLSRHAPTKEQIDELTQRFGTVDIQQVSRTITHAQEVLDLKRVTESAEVVANLPLNLLQKITHRGIAPIRSATVEVPYFEGESKVPRVHRRHDHFERIESVDVRAHPLSQEAR